MTRQDLERGISDARDRGDETRLRELQEEYRRTVPAIRVMRGPGAIRLIEPAATRSAPAPARPAPSVQREAVPSQVCVMPNARETIENFDLAWGGESGGVITGLEADGEIIVHLA
jgi:hypothetical protein